MVNGGDIAKKVKVSHTTVAKARTDAAPNVHGGHKTARKEANGRAARAKANAEIPHKTERKAATGRNARGRKPEPMPRSTSQEYRSKISKGA